MALEKRETDLGTSPESSRTYSEKNRLDLLNFTEKNLSCKQKNLCSQPTEKKSLMRSGLFFKGFDPKTTIIPGIIIRKKKNCFYVVSRVLDPPSDRIGLSLLSQNSSSWRCWARAFVSQLRNDFYPVGRSGGGRRSPIRAPRGYTHKNAWAWRGLFFVGWGVAFFFVGWGVASGVTRAAVLLDKNNGIQICACFTIAAPIVST